MKRPVAQPFKAARADRRPEGLRYLLAFAIVVCAVVPFAAQTLAQTPRSTAFP
jgi:hypothetical protein